MSLLIDLTKSVRGKSIDKVDLPTYEMRIETCKSCPYLNKLNQCRLCGCFVKDKAKYSDEFCPMKKW